MYLDVFGAGVTKRFIELVSCSTYKELGSHHSVLTTNKKAEETEKSTTLQGHPVIGEPP